MELGEKIRQARLDAGLSQRQLCGQEITRNMLSLIENGGAKPSMKTLNYLAGRLGKPLSWFVDEQAPEQEVLLQSARNLRLAAEALAEGKDRYAAQLLDGVTEPRLQREKLLLRAKVPGTCLGEICEQLPSLDEELLLRAEYALETGKGARCRQLLAAVEDPSAIRWNFLMGKLEMTEKNWSDAAVYLQQAEVDPRAIPMLETCFRELGDYRMAYEYACKQR